MPYPIAYLIYPHLNPVALKLGPLAVRWYGLAYLAGFLMAYIGLRQMIARGILRLSSVALTDLITWLVIGVIVGGRTGWWLFYHRDPGYPEPWYEPFAIWRGGMAFHGAFIGVCIVLLTWSLWNHAPLWNISDCAALVTPIGLFFGRIANFINGELVGRPTKLPWGMLFPGHALPRHPSQLYEAFLEGPLLLAILWGVWRFFHLRDGRIAVLFIICYGLFRFAVEFTREPDVQLGFIAFGWLTMGQLLSLAIIVFGLILAAVQSWQYRHWTRPKLLSSRQD